MNPNDIAPMIVGTTLILVTGGVVLLRPLTKRLGDYLETLTRARRAPQAAIEPRIVETLERMEERLRMLEDRQDFTDSLLNRAGQKAHLESGTRAVDRQG